MTGTKWQPETDALRQIALACGLSEEKKWGKPCFVLAEDRGSGKNVVLVQGFKDYVALLFFQGALLSDPANLLHRVGENSRAARQLRFTSPEEVTAQAETIKTYVLEALHLEQTGQRVDMAEGAELNWPAELQEKFAQEPELQSAFESLMPGRQRAYLLHFSAAKQPKTRTARIEKYAPHILAGKGPNDR